MLLPESPIKSNSQEPKSLGLLYLIGEAKQRSLVQVPAAVIEGTLLVQPPPLYQPSGEQQYSQQAYLQLLSMIRIEAQPSLTID